MQRWFQVSNITLAARVALPRQSHLALVLDIWVYLVSCARPKSRKRLAARTVTSKTQVRHEPNCWTRTTNFTAKKNEMLALRGNQIYSGIESCFFLKQQERVNICTSKWDSFHLKEREVTEPWTFLHRSITPVNHCGWRLRFHRVPCSAMF